MPATPKWVRGAVRALILLIVLVNVPGVDDWLRDVTGSEGNFAAAAWLLAVLVLGLAFGIWLAAIQHLRGNVELRGGQRTLWQVITYGAFIFGALAYYWRFMRASVIR